MKHKLLLTSLLSLVLAGASAYADTLIWSGNGTTLGGAGTWNTTLARWGTSTSGPFTTVWNNASTVYTNATLSAGDGTYNGGVITLAAPVTIAGTLTWQQTPGTYLSYSISGTSTMTFSPGSTLSCNNSVGGSVAVGMFNCPYAGTITKVGAAQIEFNNANGNVTKYIINAGTASFAHYNRYTTTGVDIPDFFTLNGGSIRPNTTTAWTMGRSITVGSSSGTINGSSASITVTLDKPITWASSSGYLRLYTCQYHLASTSSSGSGYLAPYSTQGTYCDAAGVIPSGVWVVFGANCTLYLSNHAQIIGTLSANAFPTATVNLGSATLTLSNGRSAYSGIISGTGGLVKQGTSEEVLYGNNTYSGATTVSAGKLTLAGLSTCIGATTVSSAATLRIATNTLAFPNSPIYLSAGATLDVGDQDTTIAILSGSGNVISNANGDSTIFHTLTVNSNLNTGGVFQNYSCYSGTISNGNLVKDGTHAMALRGTNIFSGGTISFGPSGAAGTLSVGAAPDRIPPTTALTVPAGATFQLDASSQTLASLAGGGNVNLGGGTLTINDNYNYSFSGVIRDADTNSPTGFGHGLRGYYYDNIDMTNLKVVRDDSTVNFPNFNITNNVTGLPDAGIAGANFSVRWLGKVLTTAAGTYQFTTICDDGSRLWVNGALLVDNWIGQAATNKSGTITLAGNTQYDIVMEYFQGTGQAGAFLLWTPPGDVTTNVIPTDYLFLPGPGALVMGGSSLRTFGNANTYSGNTVVAAGTLTATADGALGNGNVIVSNANLTFQYNGGTNGYMSVSADLLLNGSDVSPLVNISYDNSLGTQNIRGLSYNGGATYQPAGTYGAIGSSATYTDARFGASGILNVVGAPTTIGLTSSGSPSAVYGTPLTLTATVTPAGVTGSVLFYVGANLLGSAAVNGLGVATWSVSNLQVSVATHSLTAVYQGDTTHTPSTSSTVTQATTAATLTPNVVVSDKTYDSTTAATISSATTFNGILASDTNYVHIVGTAVASFRDKNVGTGKPVDVTGLALSGSLASNYQMLTTSATVTASITNKVLTVAGLTATNKVYDATTSAGFTGTPTLAGIVGSEVVTLGGTPVATFDTKMVATNKTVTVNGYTIGGADSSNYSLPPTTLKANITQFPISVGGLSIVPKIYDGTNSATLSGTAVFSPALFGGDVVTLGGTPIASYNNKNAGTGKAVTVIGYVTSGADATNYNLSQPTGLTGTINTVPTSCVLVSSVNPSTNSQNVTFTATFTANPLPVVNDAPTGTASFTVGGIPVASPTVVSNAPGKATAVWSTTTLALGTNTVLAAYLTDGNYQASNNSLQQVVNIPSSASPVTITNIVNNHDGTFTINYGGGAGTAFVLVKSSALTLTRDAWTPVFTNGATPGSFTNTLLPGIGVKWDYSIMSK